MRFIYVDDEQNAIVNFQFYIQDRPLVTSLDCFTSPTDALQWAEEHPFDVAFLDIQMPEMTGFELADKLKKLQPNIEIIYATAFNNHHQEAYQSGGRAYLLKPFNKTDVDELFLFLNKMSPAYAALREERQTPTSDIFIQTFGNFDLWINDAPVIFKTAKSKELLAVLVNQRGCVVSSVEIFNFLWPTKIYSKSTATYVRKTVQALKAQLAELGCSELVTFSRNAFYVNRTVAACDYFSTIAGDSTYLASYNGYFMAQYPWAEESIYIIEQSLKSLAAQLAQGSTTTTIQIPTP